MTLTAMTTQQTAVPDLLTVRVWRMTHEAEGVVSLELRPDSADGGLPEWSPGAHIDVHVADLGCRQYSLCGSPYDQDTWRIAIRDEPTHKAISHWLNTRARPGDQLQVSAPRNHFPMSHEAASYLLVAGGIGITPLLPMLAELEQRARHWHLLYGGRSLASMPFQTELHPFRDRVTFWPEDTKGFPDLVGMIRANPDAHVYACGPEPMLDALAVAVGPDHNRLHVERFTPRTIDTAGDHAFDVELVRSGTILHVPADRSVLDVIEAAGVLIASSCREGTCGTCEAPVVAGAVEHRDSVLSDAERASGRCMLTCVSRAATGECRLILDM